MAASHASRSVKLIAKVGRPRRISPCFHNSFGRRVMAQWGHGLIAEQRAVGSSQQRRVVLGLGLDPGSAGETAGCRIVKGDAHDYGALGGVCGTGKSAWLGSGVGNTRQTTGDER